jgi:hypothetical protein
LTDELRVALRGKKRGAGIAIAAAAKRIVEQRLDALAPELGDAFARLHGPDAKQLDPICRGKIAIARALYELDRWDERVFVVGLHVVQVESGEDTAAELRGVCGLAHVQLDRDDALDVLAELLADPTRTARVAAAQGIGNLGRVDGAALLRFKLLVGDDEPEVLAECFASLLALGRAPAIDFAIARLGAYDACAEAAALALGGARASVAVAALVAWCERASAEQRHRVGFLALALTRDDAAAAHLVATIRTGAARDALAAAKALATFDDMHARIREAARDAAPAVRAEIDQIVGTLASRD